MATISYKAPEAKKLEVINHLKQVLDIIEHCPDSMLFKIDFEIDAIDPRFSKIAQEVVGKGKVLNQLKQELQEKDIENYNEKN